VYNVSTWTFSQGAVFFVVVQLGMELLHRLVIPLLFGGADDIPMTGKHLEQFSAKDIFFILFNKAVTPLFIYHMLQYVNTSDRVYWKPEEVSLSNFGFAIPFFYIAYDFFYVLFHRALHLRALYPLVHKHHHRQAAPTRGNYDAMNVHPFEYLSGEYLHLLCIVMIPCHIYAVALFVALSGLFASLNHTRHDISFPGVYAVRAHDLHHHKYLYNYGQYIMFWDQAMGTYQHSEYKISKQQRSEEK